MFTYSFTSIATSTGTVDTTTSSGITLPQVLFQLPTGIPTTLPPPPPHYYGSQGKKPLHPGLVSSSFSRLRNDSQWQSSNWADYPVWKLVQEWINIAALDYALVTQNNSLTSFWIVCKNNPRSFCISILLTTP
jgi:hypothetical protein